MKLVFFIPTYNEKENVIELVKALHKLYKESFFVVVDDDSPDGTGQALDELSRMIPGITVMHRKERGRGTAGREGLQKALQLGADAVVEMDADFSHRPEDVGKLLEALNDSDLVVGSRYVQGGKEENRNTGRKITSQLANFYIRRTLNLSVMDCTSGFRAYRKEALQSIPWDSLLSTGPSIVVETLYYIKISEHRIKEVPITYAKRKSGKSTLTLNILLKTLFFVPQLKFKRRA